MGIQNIENKSVIYSVLKSWAKWWHNKIFYRKIIVLGIENIPENGHLLFTPNHQNALMDALGPLFTIPRLLVFLARADIFKKKWVARILYFIKIMPVFRIRDGYDSLKKNDAIFQKTVDVLNSGNGLVILPEGNHAGIHKLRPLKKGFARIAFKAEEENNFSLNLQIVPIGLYYSDYESFRSSLLVNFGKPISISNYEGLYKNNPAIAILKLKDDLYNAMKLLVISIESEAYYNLYNHIRIYRAIQAKLEGKNEIQQFVAQKEIVEKLESLEHQKPEEMILIEGPFLHFENALKKTQLNFETLAIGSPPLHKLFCNSIFLFCGFPAFVYGYMNNFLPWQITVSLAGGVKDPQFRSSFKYVLSLFLFPIFYFLQISTLYIFTSEKWLVVIYLLSLPISAGFSWYYYNYLKKFIRNWKLIRLKYFKPTEYNKLTELFQKITHTISGLLSGN